MIAEMKGVTTTEIGIVFEIYSLTNLCFSPFSAELIRIFGITTLSLLGLLVSGITNISFGFIDRINGVGLFLGLSIAIRIIEALGMITIRNITVSIISFEFSENLEMAFAFTLTVSSLGYLLGPVIGGALLEVNGFILPFAIFGILILCTGIPVVFLHKPYPKEKSESKENILKLLPLPPVIFGAFTLFGCNFNDGLINSTLETHLRDLDFSPVETGLIFSCNELAIASSILIFGKLCEKYDIAGIICYLSSFLNFCGLILLGPAPYIPLDKNMYTLLFGLIINGSGLGGGRVGGYSLFNRGARITSLPKNMQTYGLLVSMYSSLSSFGNFVGSMLGGFLFDTFGFGWGSHFFILYHITLFGGAIIYYYISNYFSNMHGNLSDDVQSLNNETQTYGSTE